MSPANGKVKKSSVPSQSVVADSGVPVVVYKKPQKKVRTSNRPGSKGQTSRDDEGQNLGPNVKQLKLDVYRLLASGSLPASSSGVQEDSKTKARHSLAMALGAEAPRKKAVNYKQLQTELKEKKKNEQQQDILRKIQTASLTKKGGKSKQRDRKGGRSRGAKASSSSSGVGTGMGKWKGGVLCLSKDDITRIKTTKFMKF